VGIGAHHACWLLLQALFMIARVLPATSTTVSAISSKTFIGTSLNGSPNTSSEITPWWLKMNQRWTRWWEEVAFCHGSSD
jgi:hypothetical protein